MLEHINVHSDVVYMHSFLSVEGEGEREGGGERNIPFHGRVLAHLLPSFSDHLLVTEKSKSTVLNIHVADALILLVYIHVLV